MGPGVTFASFHIKGTLPVVKEKLKRSVSGEDRGVANSREIRLFMASGPVAFPSGRDLRIYSTS